MSEPGHAHATHVATLLAANPASGATAREAGLTVHVTAETHTIEGLVSALRSYLHADRAAVPGEVH